MMASIEGAAVSAILKILANKLAPSMMKQYSSIVGVNVGDECFNSLVQVSFLQDVKEYFGRVCCEMHDLLHDLAQFILDEQISTNVPKDATSSTKYHRYFSLVQQPKKPLPRMFFKNARAIYVDGGDCDDIIFNKAKNAKHLCSIIANNNLSTTVLTAIF